MALPPARFTIQLLADNNINPGNPIYTIATVQDSSLTDSLQDYFFLLAQPQVLSANTRYWISLSSTDNSVANWSWTVDTSRRWREWRIFCQRERRLHQRQWSPIRCRSVVTFRSRRHLRDLRNRLHRDYSSTLRRKLG